MFWTQLWGPPLTPPLIMYPRAFAARLLLSTRTPFKRRSILLSAHCSQRVSFETNPCPCTSATFSRLHVCYKHGADAARSSTSAPNTVMPLSHFTHGSLPMHWLAPFNRSRRTRTLQQKKPPHRPLLAEATEPSASFTRREHSKDADGSCTRTFCPPAPWRTGDMWKNGNRMEPPPAGSRLRAGLMFRVKPERHKTCREATTHDSSRFASLCPRAERRQGRTPKHSEPMVVYGNSPSPWAHGCPNANPGGLRRGGTQKLTWGAAARCPC